MKGWKVISSHRQSCRSRFWRMSNRWTINYPVGVEVFPKVEGSKIFFFKDEHDALSFSTDYELIVPCIAKNVVKVKWVGGYIDCINDFWKNRRKSTYRMVAPSGTYLAESITCLK